ncbi:MAG: hypothetical protein U0359_25655 [Byssovorax sp.]
MIQRFSRALGLTLLTGFAALTPACGSGDGVVTGDEDDLTSVTARERKLTFEGYVYVSASASSKVILEAVQRQTKSAFGALRIANVAVSHRELSDVDAKQFKKEPVTVVDPETRATSSALRVRYRYTDQAIVPKTMARRSSLELGLLHGDYQSQSDRILEECTENSEEDREMADEIWYVYNPSLDRCQTAMAKEQDAIDADRLLLEDLGKQIVPKERKRLYVPMTVKLEAAAMTQGTAYPEYDRLWSGGVEPGTLVVGLLNGIIGHGEPGKTHPINEDEGYLEMLGQMDEILKARPALTVVKTDPATDLSVFTISGKKITGVTFRDFIDWELHGTSFPKGLTAAEKSSLKTAVAERLLRRWVTFEETVSVKIGSKAAKSVKVRIEQYFGADEDEAPYRRALKKSDVFVFNGHSFIGSGPLDPANFSASDIPESYQIYFVDSCVSFNYYNKDFYAFKSRGARDLDTITNGMESFSDGSGAAEGRFVAALLGGEQPSYKKLLQIAGTTGTDYDWGKDAMRVVDGEIENSYSPTKTPIKVTEVSP